MPWSALKRDPLRFLGQECFPTDFQWSDPSHLREALAIQLVDHIWDMQNPGEGREAMQFRLHHVESHKGPDSPLVPASYSSTPLPVPSRTTSSNIFDINEPNSGSDEDADRSATTGGRANTAPKTIAQRVQNALSKRERQAAKAQSAETQARKGKKANKGKKRKGKGHQRTRDVDEDEIGSHETDEEFDDWTKFEDEIHEENEDGFIDGDDEVEDDCLIAADVPMSDDDEDEDEETVQNALEDLEEDLDVPGEFLTES